MTNHPQPKRRCTQLPYPQVYSAAWSKIESSAGCVKWHEEGTWPAVLEEELSQGLLHGVRLKDVLEALEVPGMEMWGSFLSTYGVSQNR